MDEPQVFDRKVCSVYHPAAVMAHVQESMRQALTIAARDSAVPSAVRRLITPAFEKTAGC